MDKSSSNTNPIAKLFFLAIAIWAVPLYQGGKYLIGRALDGLWGGLLAFFVGLPAAIAGGIVAGNWVGWTTYPEVAAWSHGWMPHFLWGIAGVIAGAASFWILLTYVWSALYIWGISPVNKAAEKVRKFFDRVARDHYAKGEESFLGAVKTVFQPSSLWSSVQEKDKKGTWVKGLSGAVGYMSLVAGTGYLGWLTLTGVQELLVGYIGHYAWLPAALIAYFVVFTVGPFLSDFMDYARLSFTAVVCGGASAYALMPLTGSIVNLSGATTGHAVAAYAGIFAIEGLAFVAYVFPALYLLLTGGLIKRIADAVEKLFDTVLDEKKTNFRRLFHELVTIATVWRFTTLSLMLWALLGMSSGWSAALAIAVGALTYVLVGAFLEVGREWSIGNSVIGFLFCAHMGGMAGYSWAQHGYLFGTWGAIVAGVVTFLALFCVAYPLSYKVARFLCDLTGASYLGVPLGFLHDQAWKGFRWVMKKFEKVYEKGYWDDRKETVDGNYRKAFLHVVNLLSLPVGFFAGALVWKALGLVSALTIPAGLLVAFLAYLLLGQVIIKGGTYLVGSVAAIIGGSGTGALAYGAVAFEPVAQKLYVAVPVGILAWFAVFFFVFPAAYIVLRLLTSWSAGFVLATLGGIYDACWKVFDKLVWQPFLVVYRFVRDYLWSPVWKTFKWVCAKVWSVWLSVWNGVKDAWNGMFGRKTA